MVKVTFSELGSRCSYPASPSRQRADADRLPASASFTLAVENFPRRIKEIDIRASAYSTRPMVSAKPANTAQATTSGFYGEYSCSLLLLRST